MLDIKVSHDWFWELPHMRARFKPVSYPLPAPTVLDPAEQAAHALNPDEFATVPGWHAAHTELPVALEK